MSAIFILLFAIHRTTSLLVWRNLTEHKGRTLGVNRLSHLRGFFTGQPDAFKSQGHHGEGMSWREFIFLPVAIRRVELMTVYLVRMGTDGTAVRPARDETVRALNFQVFHR